MYRVNAFNPKGLVFICIFLVTFSSHARAIIVQADITSDTFRWRSASPSLFIDGSVVPSIWATPIGLTPAYAFYPGGGGNINMTITLSNGEHSVILPLKVSGMEYNSPEAVALSTVDNRVKLSGTLVQVEGDGVSKDKVLLSRQVTPFTHARPIFSLGSSSEIVASFKALNVPAGSYSGTVSIPQSYDYDLSQSKVRYNWSLPLEIVIDYTPTYLTAVVATGTTMIKPYYYREDGQHYIAGETTYMVNASGYFTDGLLLRLKFGDEYIMRLQDTSFSSGDFIPLSVFCSSCFDRQLVENGEPMAKLFKTGTAIDGIGSDIQFFIEIKFKTLVGNVTDGVYNGRFAVIISPKI